MEVLHGPGPFTEEDPIAGEDAREGIAELLGVYPSCELAGESRAREWTCVGINGLERSTSKVPWMGLSVRITTPLGACVVVEVELDFDGPSVAPPSPSKTLLLFDSYPTVGIRSVDAPPTTGDGDASLPQFKHE